MDIADLKAKLDALNITYHHRAGVRTLKSMYDKAMETQEYLNQNAKP